MNEKFNEKKMPAKKNPNRKTKEATELQERLAQGVVNQAEFERRMRFQTVLS